MTTFRGELESIINKHSQENGSNSPNFLLADFLCNCLRAFDSAVNQRERYYDRDPGMRAPLQPAGMELPVPPAWSARTPESFSTAGVTR